MSMVPLFSAKIANSGINIKTALNRVVDRCWYVLGEEVAKFEADFAHYVGVRSCISAANGTDAIELALRGLGVKSGDKVVTVANAGFYSSTAIHAVGATPIYADVDSKTMTMSPAALILTMSELPRAIIVTHLYGQLADMEALLSVANRFNVPVIEDCAQAHGARRNGRMAGSFGALACFSFYPTKNLGAIGDGGAVVTSDDDLAKRISSLRQYGWSSKYQVSLEGGRNSRLDEVQAAVLSEKLPHLDGWNRERRDIAKRYNLAFKLLPVILPFSLDEDYVAHLYVLRVARRDQFRAFLGDLKISTDVHYPIPDYRQPLFNANVVSDFPVTDEISNTVVSLPCFPGLTEIEVERVIAAVKSFFSGE
jgi:aminotransferase EvaB